MIYMVENGDGGSEVDSYFNYMNNELTISA